MMKLFPGKFKFTKKSIFIIMGLLLIFLSTSADYLGFSSRRFWSIGQWIVLMSGSCLLLTGIVIKASEFGNRFALLSRAKHIYVSVAKILLNTIIMFIILEIASASALDIRLNYGMRRWSSQPYYQSFPWSKTLWDESRFVFDQDPVRYHPYTIWRRARFDGQTIHVNDEGIRVTPNSDCSAEKVRIFLFGGSAMWGFGSPDWATIPAFLQENLNEIYPGVYCVVNYGEPAFVSTQNLIQLEMDLQRGNIPGMAVFYDGVNDVLGAYQTGHPGYHQNYYQIKDGFEQQEGYFVTGLKGTNFYRLMEVILAKIPFQKGYLSSENLDRFALSVADAYMQNIKITQSIASSYNFESVYFWQPVISFGDRDLLPAEQESRGRMPESLVALYQKVYQQINNESLKDDNLVFLGNELDDYKGQIWIDPYHITPDGNELIAKKIAEVIVPLLPNQVEVR